MKKTITIAITLLVYQLSAQTWVEKLNTGFPENDNEIILGFNYVTATEGYVLGLDRSTAPDSLMWWKTEDAGDTWTKRKLVEYETGSEDGFSASIKLVDGVMIIAARNRVFMSSDNGVNWTYQDYPTNLYDNPSQNWVNGGGFEWNSALFTSPSNGFIVGSVSRQPSQNSLFYETAAAASTTDGGQTWSVIILGDTTYNGSLLGDSSVADVVKSVDGLNVFAITERRVGGTNKNKSDVFKSEDGGQSWVMLPTNTSFNITDAVQLNNDTLVIIGNDVTGLPDPGFNMVVTKNGGQTWDGVDILNGTFVLNIAHDKGDGLFISTNSEGVVYTPNLGASFQNTNTDQAFWALEALSVNTIQGFNPFSFSKPYALYELNATVLSVDNDLRSNGVSIFPNPSSGVLSVESQNSESFRIYNSQGAYIDSKPTNEMIDISSLKSGMYLIRVADQTFKFIKE